ENVLANVYVDFDTTGRIAAELLSSQLPAGSRILICAGAPDVVSQRGVVQGFTSYIDEKSPELGYVYLYGDGGGEQMSLLSLRLKDMLMRDSSISAVFCVNARGSAVAAQVFRELDLGGKIRLVGSDIFKENIEAMQDGIMQNIVYKAPHQQAYKAAKILFDYLLRGIPPFQSDFIIKSSIVFQSNLHMYID
ncbi:MAG: substrate-binding domain-containing protein, partial [Oscillospiraceae bacterium]|nr:substrate-binding domain-containing protein [Oscillospiraceae bacterium]